MSASILKNINSMSDDTEFLVIEETEMSDYFCMWKNKLGTFGAMFTHNGIMEENSMCRMPD